MVKDFKYLGKKEHTEAWHSLLQLPWKHCLREKLFGFVKWAVWVFPQREHKQIFWHKEKLNLNLKHSLALKNPNERSFLVLQCNNYAPEPKNVNIHTHAEALLGPCTPLSIKTFAARGKPLDFLALACWLTHRSPLPESLCNPHFSVIEWTSQVPITGEKRSLVAILCPSVMTTPILV